MWTFLCRALWNLRGDTPENREIAILISDKEMEIIKA
jgi:hypothetical protein